MWGTWALYHAPRRGHCDVHRSYAEVGCDVISTNTWGIQGAVELEPGGEGRPGRPTHWMDVARLGIRLAREAAAAGGRRRRVRRRLQPSRRRHSDEQGPERSGLLARVFEDEPPDFVLLETMSLIHELTFQAVETLLDTGIPVWLSFRRCRHGLCGVFGQHWGGPEGDLFGRAARRFEEMGVAALLINCIPPDHVDGMLPWLRDFTDLPLGVYPNLGYYTESGWAFDQRIGGEEFAELAAAGATRAPRSSAAAAASRPHHIGAAATRLAGTTRAAARQRRRRLDRRGRRVRAGRARPARAVARRAGPARLPAADARAHRRARRVRADRRAAS